MLKIECNLVLEHSYGKPLFLKADQTGHGFYSKLLHYQKIKMGNSWNKRLIMTLIGEMQPHYP